MTETVKKRGRPATGKALTAADKQRAYRERQKHQVKTSVDDQALKALTDKRWELESKLSILTFETKKKIENLELMNSLLSKDLSRSRAQADELQVKVWELEVQLSKKEKKSNVTKIYKQVDIED